MRYSIGDIVKFKIGYSETDKGEVKFIEEDSSESILYINSRSGWAYKVPEKKSNYSDTFFSIKPVNTIKS